MSNGTVSDAADPNIDLLERQLERQLERMRGMPFECSRRLAALDEVYPEAARSEAAPRSSIRI